MTEKELLEKYYWEDRLSPKQIKEMYGIVNVDNKLKKYGILKL